MYSRLEGPKIVKTLDRLTSRISERFPHRNLGKVAKELTELADRSNQRIRSIRSPILVLRLLCILLSAGFAGILVMFFGDVASLFQEDNVSSFIQILEPTLNCLVFAGAFLLFFWSLENRIKRNRALHALHELRSMVHIIDMHQLTKDPERLLRRDGGTKSSPRTRFTPFLLGRYLDYCSEMLSLISKVAALYVQDLEDPVVLNAVDQIEVLTTGLARKIWQKIMILDRMAPIDETTDLGATVETEPPEEEEFF